jgi:hypothetical protein
MLSGHQAVFIGHYYKQQNSCNYFRPKFGDLESLYTFGT